MKKFRVIENNGGGLILVTFAADGETMDYIHSGYEYVPGQLSQDLQELRKGGDPIADDWDGNEIAELGTDFNAAFPGEQEGIGWECIVDNDGEYQQKMGGAGQDEFPVVNVLYEAGESQKQPGKCIDYMLACVVGDADDFKAEYGDGLFLYAEAENSTWTVDECGDPVCEDENATYNELKAEIIRQAKEKGIDPARLHFWLDD